MYCSLDYSKFFEIQCTEQQDLLHDGKHIFDSVVYFMRVCLRMDKHKSFVFSRRHRNCFSQRIIALLLRN